MTFDPSTSVAPCERLTASVQATDPDGDALTYQFAVIGTPPTDAFVLEVSGNVATFSSSVAGEYLLELRGCDGRGCVPLEVPLTVAGAPAGGGTCAVSCDDGNPCTTDARAASGVCSHVTVADGTLCSGGNLRVKLLGFNDFHGQLAEGRLVAGRPVGGAAVLASYLQRRPARASRARPSSSTPATTSAPRPPDSALLQDEPSIPFLNLLANDACAYPDRMNPACNLVGTLGNHEFDEGSGELLRLLDGGNYPTGPFLEDPYRGARFPYVSANVVDDDQRRADPAALRGQAGPRRPGRVHRRRARRRRRPSSRRRGVAGLQVPRRGRRHQRYVPGLKAMGVRVDRRDDPPGRHPDLVHRPDPHDRRTDDQRPGHPGHRQPPRRRDRRRGLGPRPRASPTRSCRTRSGKSMLVTQAFSASTAYGDIDLLIDPVTRDVVSKTAQIVTTFSDVAPGPDAAIRRSTAMVNAAGRGVAPLVNEVVGDAPAPITRTENAAGESTLGNLIADAQRAAMGTQLAFMNPGGIRADLDAGPITWGELFTHPALRQQPGEHEPDRRAGHSRARAAVAGQPFPRIMKISGFDYTWNPAAPVGGRIVEVRVGGAPIDPAATYSITCNNFMATGGDNFTTFIAGTNQVGGPIDLDALDRLRRGPHAARPPRSKDAS